MFLETHWTFFSLQRFHIAYQFSIDGASGWNHFFVIDFLASVLRISNKCFVLIFVEVEHKRPKRSSYHLNTFLSHI